MSKIHLHNVSKKYKTGGATVMALDSLNLELDGTGKLIVVAGPSGAGKSTLLHILGTMDSPTSGEVEVNGVALGTLSEEETVRFRKRHIGFVFQFFNLIPVLSAIENVVAPQMFDKEQDFDRAAALLKRFGLVERLGHRPPELSGGEQQRVAIARALINNPETILADEPTANLDSKNGFEVIQTLKDISKEGRTVIIATHNERITDFADIVLMMKDGRLVPAETCAPAPRPSVVS